MVPRDPAYPDAATQRARVATLRQNDDWSRLLDPPIRVLTELGGVVRLGGEVLWSVVRHPRGHWTETRDEMFRVLTRSAVPMVLAVFTFALMIGILGLNFLNLLGAAYRYGQYFFIVNTRDFTPWINSMVVAGIVGTALCADLGARVIREEIDALEVLGLDPVRELVVPRVLSISLLTPLLMVVSLVMGIVGGLYSTVTYGNVPAADYWDTLFKNLTSVELVVGVGKSAIIGFVTGIVCAHKGLSARGGSIGVGRAVNEAVVMSFVLVFLVDFAVNVSALGLFPEMGSVR
jgi:phospholipid/cholesterol/gamma-HCH transport system permease protein